MQSASRILALLVLAFGVLPACGSPFVKGWRDDEREERTPQEQCEAIKNHQWVNGSCQDKGSLNLDGIGEADCKKVENTVWKNERCVYFKDLTTAAECSNVGWSWAEGRCMQPAEAQCLADANSQWVEDHCVVRPTIVLEGPATQALAIGGVFAPAVVKPSAGAAALVDAQTCTGFFVISGDKLTSVAAAADKPVCEADLVSTKDGAKSKPIRVKATVDKGFLSYCNQLINDPAAQRKEPELTETVFKLVAASKKQTCDDAAKELQPVTDLDLSGSGISDLRPVAGFTQLSQLNLSDNPAVKDLSPIAYLPNLRVLWTGGTYLDARPAQKTEANCPTGDGVAFAVYNFCRIKE